MRVYIIIFLFLFFRLAEAQEMPGLHTDNYAGVYSLKYNPAEIVDSNYKWHINVFSFNTTLASDFLGIDSSAIFSGDNTLFSTTNISELLSPSYSLIFNKESYSDRNLYATGEISLFPSFMFNFGGEVSQALGFSFRTRYQINTTGVFSDLVLNSYNRETLTHQDLDNTLEDSSLQANVWNEYAVTYGRMLKTGVNNVSLAATVKITQGFAGAYGQFSDSGGATIPNTSIVDKTSKISLKGDLDFGQSRVFNIGSGRADISNLLLSTNIGFGLDLGAVWEVVPEETEKYKYKIGLSLLDLGYVPFATFDGDNATYTMQGVSASLEDFTTEIGNQLDDKTSLTGFVNVFQSASSSKEDKESSFTAFLPAKVNAYIDYLISPKLYANASISYYPNIGDALFMRGLSTIAITPRYETKNIGLFLPVSMDFNKEVSVGLGIRTGYFTIGVRDVLPLVSAKQEIYSTNFYIGASIPIFKKRNDKAEEQLSDKLQEESDSVNLENTIELESMGDDSTEEAVLENTADQTSDQKVDSQDVRKTSQKMLAVDTETNLDVYSVSKYTADTPVEVKKVSADLTKTVGFNSDRYTLDASKGSLLDPAVEFLKSHPDYNLEVSVHTDSVGSANENMMLSQRRANFIKTLFIMKGLSPSRLQVKAYGESKPIATNKTAKGRAKNRRVDFYFYPKTK